MMTLAANALAWEPAVTYYDNNITEQPAMIIAAHKKGSALKIKQNRASISENDNPNRIDYTTASKHAASILKAAAAYYSEGDTIKAWELIDRYCRINANPEPCDYVFRAQILYQIDQKILSIRDLEGALKIEPENHDANRRLLAWAESHNRRKTAALNLLRSSKYKADLIEAGKYMIQYGDLDCCISYFITNGKIHLKTIWQRPLILKLKIRDSPEVPREQQEISLDIGGYNETNNDQEYKINEVEHVWSIVPETIEITAQRVCKETGELKAAKIYLAENHNLTPETQPAVAATGGFERRIYTQDPLKCRSEATARAFPIAVIIPVYKDFYTLEGCLESLKKIENKNQIVVIIINDASPEAKIQLLLDTVQWQEGEIKIIENKENLGFVGSVNKGLEQVNISYPNSDVILLNSDTIVAPNFADHLMEAAYISDDIGTVTPLSNNGEYTSFPIPFVANAEVNYEQVNSLDNAAYEFSEEVIDIPAGVGFCLFIKRDCLNAVGILDETVTDGYLEDLDFSMRTRAKGLRNVCAAGVFVGHYGTRSFTTRKRALVVKNMKQLENKFRNHASESAAFIAMDPLHKYRCKLEASLISKITFQSIIIHSTDTSKYLLLERIFDHRSRGRKVLLLETFKNEIVKLKDPDGGVPQSLECDLSILLDVNLLTRILTNQRNLTAEMIDLEEENTHLTAIIYKINIKLDIFISKPTSLLVNSCDRMIDCNGRLGKAKQADSKVELAKYSWTTCAEYQERSNQDITESHIRFLPIDEQALSDISRIYTSRKLAIDKSKMWKRLPRTGETQTVKDQINMAIVDLKGNPDELSDLIAMVEIFTKHEFDYRMVVFGRTYHDLSIMRSGRVIAKGHTCISEFEDQFEIHDINLVLSIPRNRSYYEEYDLVSAGFAMPYGRFSYTYEDEAHSMIQKTPFTPPARKNSVGMQIQPAGHPNVQIKQKLPSRSVSAIRRLHDISISNQLPSLTAAAEIANWARGLLKV